MSRRSTVRRLSRKMLTAFGWDSFNWERFGWQHTTFQSNNTSGGLVVRVHGTKIYCHTLTIQGKLVTIFGWLENGDACCASNVDFRKVYCK